MCRKERLTFYNFLRLHLIDENEHNDERIKEMINREYMIYFEREKVADIYEEANPFSFRNKLDKKFNINF